MVFLDIETQNTFDSYDSFNMKDLRISYIGVISLDKEYQEIDIWEKDMDKLGEILRSTDIVVGYNIVRFDMPIIANYVGEEMNNLPMIDLMLAAKTSIGFYPKLNNLADATLGDRKLGNGLDAVKYFARGELDKLKKYCMQDVLLTKQLYEYGESNKKIKYYDKNGFLREAPIEWQNGAKNLLRSDKDDIKFKQGDNKNSDVISLF